MRRIYETEIRGDTRYANDLLMIQNWYNNELRILNDNLAKRRADALTQYQNRANAEQSAATDTTKSQNAEDKKLQSINVDQQGQLVVKPQSNNAPAATESYINIENRYTISNRMAYKSKRINKNISKLIKEIKNIDNNIEDDLDVPTTYIKRKTDDSGVTLKMNDLDIQNRALFIDYLDAENISYSSDEDYNEIYFDISKLNKEWRTFIEDIQYTKNEKGYDDSENIISIHTNDNETDFYDTHDKINDKGVFYVKITHNKNTFIGKIYKMSSDGDWIGKVIDGYSKTFEKLNYDPDFDEIDIIAFLRENYENVQLINSNEIHLKEAAQILAPIAKAVGTQVIGAAINRTVDNVVDRIDKSLNKTENEQTNETEEIVENSDEICEDEQDGTEISESKKHKILNFDEFVFKMIP